MQRPTDDTIRELRALLEAWSITEMPGPFRPEARFGPAMWFQNANGDSIVLDANDAALIINALPDLLDALPDPGRTVTLDVAWSVILSDEQTAILRDHLASRQQTVSEFFGDVLMEYGLGRATGKEYPPPMTDAPHDD